MKWSFWKWNVEQTKGTKIWRVLKWIGASKVLEKVTEAGFWMVGIRLGAIAMEWIETESEIGGIGKALKRWGMDQQRRCPPLPLYSINFTLLHIIVLWSWPSTSPFSWLWLTCHGTYFDWDISDLLRVHPHLPFYHFNFWFCPVEIQGFYSVKVLWHEKWDRLHFFHFVIMRSDASNWCFWGFERWEIRFCVKKLTDWSGQCLMWHKVLLAGLTPAGSIRAGLIH